MTGGEMTHTPGPWRAIESRNGGHYIDTANGDDVACPEYQDGMDLQFGPITERDDANLIAAAPDLLKALDGLLGIVRESRGVCGYHLNGDEALWGEFEDVDFAYAAIAKAEGRDHG